LNVHYINHVTQTEIHTANSLVPEPYSEVEIIIEKLEVYKFRSSDQIQAELNQAEGKNHVLSTASLLHLE
jgi:hypothetical protein